MICTSWGTACINFSTWELWNHIIFVQYSKHSLSGYQYMAGITTWQWYNWANITLHWDSSSASLKTYKGNLTGKTFNFPYSCFESFDDHDVKVEWLEEMQYVRWLHVQYIYWFKITRHHHYWIWSNKCTSNIKYDTLLCISHCLKSQIKTSAVIYFPCTCMLLRSLSKIIIKLHKKHKHRNLICQKQKAIKAM